MSWDRTGDWKGREPQPLPMGARPPHCSMVASLGCVTFSRPGRPADPRHLHAPPCRQSGLAIASAPGRGRPRRRKPAYLVPSIVTPAIWGMWAAVADCEQRPACSALTDLDSSSGNGPRRSWLLCVRARDKFKFTRCAYPMAMRMAGRAIGTAIVGVLVNSACPTL